MANSYPVDSVSFSDTSYENAFDAFDNSLMMAPSDGISDSFILENSDFDFSPDFGVSTTPLATDVSLAEFSRDPKIGTGTPGYTSFSPVSFIDMDKLSSLNTLSFAGTGSAVSIANDSKLTDAFSLGSSLFNTPDTGANVAQLNNATPTIVQAASEDADIPSEAEIDLMRRQKEAAENSVFGMDSQNQGSLGLGNDPYKNSDGSSDVAVTFVVDPTQFKISVGSGVSDTRATRSSAPGSLNPFGPDGAKSTTMAGSTVKALIENGIKAYKESKPGNFDQLWSWLTTPAELGIKPWFDPPSVTFSSFNDPSKQSFTPAPSTYSLGTKGWTFYPGLGEKYLASITIGSGAGTHGAPFFNDPAKSVSGSFSFSVDATTAAAEVLRRKGLSGLGDITQAMTTVGLQGRAGISIPILTIKDWDKPGIEFETPFGVKVKDPIVEVEKEIEKTIAGNTTRPAFEGEKPLNFGDKRAANFNTELQLVTGTSIWSLPPVSKNPTTDVLENNGSEALALANQFYNTLQAYGGLKPGEKITSSVDFKERVDATIGRLYDQGRTPEIDTFLTRLGNPYGVNGGSSYVAEKNATHSGTKVDAGTASHVQRVFSGQYGR